ncbi:Phenylalanyl-tRNA synthetase beta chain [Nosema bombycis CQ1]|uniref:phenylalanine--tRNA ligase n=1 Tax=Nosema bombycis (strain CQ1 / CVCC 102059) TaxID=578461 RepID=R0MFE0_NOSB1|nr:Phenylalanyl-tRNA synthetase beta chain [Nosema bombycis CQ1]|eukprot:EOB11468.1 Phenylalanyl-tRNA synthetase beta chain [Nosema bombycis CQ1]
MPTQEMLVGRKSFNCSFVTFFLYPQMPTIPVKKVDIENLLQKTYDVEEFNDLLFDFGLEIDDIEEEKGITTYKIEIPANRYDLLCTRGLALSLKSYLMEEQFKDVKIMKSEYKIIQNERNFRGEIAAAVIKNYKFDDLSYADFISYQEKLCGSLGRNRSIVAIGTHDLSKIEFPVTYDSIKKEELNFVPLRHKEEVNGVNLQKLYAGDSNISKYFNLVESDKYNVFRDLNGQILSVPPIINSEDTKITLETKDILIEVTGTNFHKVNNTLKLILNAFRTKEVYSVNIEKKNSIITTPISEPKHYDISLQDVIKELNVSINVNGLMALLKKMMYFCEKIDDYTVRVHVPMARQDVIHKVDVIEDVAISYGFNNLKRAIPQINTIGLEDPLNKFTDKIRLEMAQFGFLEVYTLALISKEENLFNSSKCVEVGNFKSLECEVGRTSLLPSLLKSVSCNLHTKIPMKIFEAGDVLFLDDSNDIGSKNVRMLGCLLVNQTSQMEEIQGPLTFLLQKCGITNFQFVRKDNEEKYLKNQSAILLIDNEEFGDIGVINPDVLKVFRLPYPGSSFEINLDKLFKKYLEKNNN